jgi:hypothetical protein
MFFFKRQEIILDCFTNDKTVLDFAPIQEASNYYPSWFYTMPKEFESGIHKSATLKKCSGFIDYYKNGIIMPLWCDLAISIENKNYKWNFANTSSTAIVHNSKQWEYFVDPNEVGHLKLNAPWKIKCNKEINFLFKKPYWNSNPFNDINIVEGIVEFKYQNTANINLLLKLNQYKEILLKYNDPLLNIIPLTEKKIKIKNHLIEFKEFQDMTDEITFVNNYRIRKKILQNKEKKCPFH